MFLEKDALEYIFLAERPNPVLPALALNGDGFELVRPVFLCSSVVCLFFVEETMFFLVVLALWVSGSGDGHPEGSW